jgi:hypothetical protein
LAPTYASTRAFSFWPGRNVTTRRALIGISSPVFGTLVFISQVEITKAGQLDLLPVGERGTHFFEEQINELPRLALIEPKLIEERFRHLRLGQGHLVILVFLRSSSHANPRRRRTSAALRLHR